MRTRSSSVAMMSEGPVAMGGDPLDLLPVLERDDRLMEAASAARGAASDGVSPSGLRCPLRSSRPGAAGRTMPSLSEPWTPSLQPYDLGTTHPEPVSFRHLVARAMEDESLFGGDGRSSSGRAGHGGATGALSSDVDGDVSPASLPCLERAERASEEFSSSSEDISSLGDAAGVAAGLTDLDGDDEALDADEGKEAEEEPASPFASVAAAAAALPPRRESRRAAAHRASARISAAIHSQGMADVEALTDRTSPWFGGGSTGRQSAARAASAAASRADALEVGLDEDDVVSQEAAGSNTAAGSAALSSVGAIRTRSRRRAGPKTTGESPAPAAAAEPPVVLRRSARKRNAAKASLKEDRDCDDSKAGLKLLEDDDDDVVVKEEPEKDAEGTQSCCICLDVPDKYELSSVNGCEHLYCFSCIEKWADRENTCPQCKKRFTKIDRVHRLPPNKRRKKGEGGDENEGRPKNSKKVKKRDQRADVSHGNPLQGLFATMEANGTMPHSIAQLIFSGLGGINGSHVSFGRSGGSTTHNRPPTRAARPGSRTLSGGGVEPFPLQPVPTPLSAMVRRLSSATRHEGPAGAASAASSSASHHRTVVSLSLDGSGGRGAAAARAPVAHLPDPWSLSAATAARSPSSSSGAAFPPQPSFGRSALPHLPDPAAHFRRDSASGASDDGGDDEEYSSFVQRVQRLSRDSRPPAERFAIGGAGSFVSSSSAGASSAGARSFGGPGSTAATALEIDDDDSDDEVIEVIQLR